LGRGDEKRDNGCGDQTLLGECPVIHLQNVKKFVAEALECSVFVNPDQRPFPTSSVAPDIREHRGL
jgi:hypothetical protein